MYTHWSSRGRGEAEFTIYLQEGVTVHPYFSRAKAGSEDGYPLLISGLTYKNWAPKWPAHAEYLEFNPLC